MTKEEIKNTPEIVDFMLDKSVIADSRMKLHKRLEEICELAIKILEQEPCDAISREDALMALTGKWTLTEEWTEEWTELTDKLIHRFIKRIKALPPVNPQPKIGHWVEENINEWSHKVFCSECGCPPPFEHVSNGDVYSASGYGVSNKTKFCPNCGARMFEP